MTTDIYLNRQKFEGAYVQDTFKFKYYLKITIARKYHEVIILIPVLYLNRMKIELGKLEYLPH